MHVYRVIKGEIYDGLSHIIICKDIFLAVRVAKHLSKKTFYDFGGGDKFLEHKRLTKVFNELIWKDKNKFVRIEKVRLH